MFMDTLRRPHAARSNLHHLKIFFARTAFGAGPVHGHVRPTSSRNDAVIGVPRCLVIDPATNQTHPSFGIAHSL